MAFLIPQFSTAAHSHLRNERAGVTKVAQGAISPAYGGTLAATCQLPADSEVAEPELG
jgi:hypothetical protein